MHKCIHTYLHVSVSGLLVSHKCIYHIVEIFKDFISKVVKHFQIEIFKIIM